MKAFRRISEICADLRTHIEAGMPQLKTVKVYTGTVLDDLSTLVSNAACPACIITPTGMEFDDDQLRQKRVNKLELLCVSRLAPTVDGVPDIFDILDDLIVVLSPPQHTPNREVRIEGVWYQCTAASIVEAENSLNMIVLEVDAIDWYTERTP